MATSNGLDARVLVCAPVGRDAPLIQQMLAKAAITTELCPTVSGVCRELAAGAAAAILTQESLSPVAVAELLGVLDAQPPWSDLPLLVLVGSGPSTPASSALVGARAQRSRDQLLAAVAHDLKNPLGAVKGHAQLLQRRAARGESRGSEQFLQGLATIDAIATRAAAQLDELLDLARSQAQQTLVLNSAAVDLVALIHATVGEHQAAAPHHQIRVQTAMPELLGVWDAARLARVLGNLLANAIKYSPPGSQVVVDLQAEDTPAGAWAVLSVRDEGLGIPPAELPRVFEPFYRASNVEGQLPGTGLGLASTRHIVERHGGSIAVASQVGGGTTFTVRLPLAPGEGPSPAGAPGRADPP